MDGGRPLPGRGYRQDQRAAIAAGLLQTDGTVQQPQNSGDDGGAVFALLAKQKRFVPVPKVPVKRVGEAGTHSAGPGGGKHTAVSTLHSTAAPESDATGVDSPPRTAATSTAPASSQAAAMPTLEQELEPDEGLGVEQMSDLVRHFQTDEGLADAINFSVWDYGGQKVFDTLHHLFLTRYGVYPLLFNMQWLVPSATAEEKTKCLHYLRDWLNSISVHTRDDMGQFAPIFLVGTHKDAFAESERPAIFQAISILLEQEFQHLPVYQVVQRFKDGEGKSPSRLCVFLSPRITVTPSLSNPSVNPVPFVYLLTYSDHGPRRAALLPGGQQAPAGSRPRGYLSDVRDRGKGAWRGVHAGACALPVAQAVRQTQGARTQGLVPVSRQRSDVFGRRLWPAFVVAADAGAGIVVGAAVL